MCKIQMTNYQVLAALTSRQTALKQVPKTKERSASWYHRIILHNDYQTQGAGKLLL